MAIKRGSKVEVGFSASSMTDLIFLLLLFMMLSTTLINPNAVKLTLPKSSNQLKEKPYPIWAISSRRRPFPSIGSKRRWSRN